MSQTLELANQVQKALAELKTLLKSKDKSEFNDEIVHLRILREMLQEQDIEQKTDHATT